METTNLATVTESPYKLALLSTRISEMKKSDAMNAFSDIFSKMYFDSGQQIPDKEYQKLLCNSWHNEVITDFKFLRIDEMKLAFHNGIRKQYGEFFGLNIATFHIWVKGFVNEERRKDALLKLKAESDIAPPPIMSKTEADYEWKQTIKKQFLNFKETGFLNIEFPSFVFNWFESNGFIKLDKEQKAEVYSQAVTKVCESKRVVRLNPKNRNELNNATAFLNRATTNQLNPADQLEIKSMARLIAIETYYKSIDKLEI